MVVAVGSSDELEGEWERVFVGGLGDFDAYEAREGPDVGAGQARLRCSVSMYGRF